MSKPRVKNGFEYKGYHIHWSGWIRTDGLTFEGWWVATGGKRPTTLDDLTKLDTTAYLEKTRDIPSGKWLMAYTHENLPATLEFKGDNPSSFRAVESGDSELVVHSTRPERRRCLKYLALMKLFRALDERIAANKAGEQDTSAVQSVQSVQSADAH